MTRTTPLSLRFITATMTKCCLLLIACATLLSSVQAAGPSYIWNTNTGSWSTAGNWVNTIVPTNNGPAYIDNGGAAILSTNGSSLGLYVGNTNSGNTLVVSNGGYLSLGTNLVIGTNVTASNNTVIVTGTGSLVLSGSGTLNFGASGSGNSLLVTNGGTLISGVDRVGIPESSLGTNAGNSNTIVVTGSGSSWTNASLYIAGTNNSVMVSGGGIFTSSNGISLQSSSNDIIVSDRNSALNQGKMFVGTGQGGNDQFIVSNFANAAITEALLVGRVGGSLSNAVSVTGGGTLTVGSMAVGGTLNANATNCGGNTVTVSGTNSTLIDSNAFVLGVYSGINSLVVSNGGMLSAATNLIGSNSTSSNNSVLVTGSNSFLNTGTWLYVGYNGAGNSMTISNQGVVSDQNGVIGFTNSSTGNSVLVTGSNSLWSNSQTANVGYGSSSNGLVISNGGKVVSGATFFIGYYTNNNNNSVQVSGSNSLLSITNPSETIYIGLGGSFNNLSITDGGKVVSGYGVLGNGSSASSNSVIVSGAGSIWTNTFDVIIGQAGSGNLLTISNGGKVYDRNGFLDAPAPGASNNVAIVSGSSSLWSNSGTLYVGTNGNGNRVVITNGGTVVASNTAISSKASDTNNSILITGQGSLLSNSGTVTVAAAGSGSLVLDQGGSLIASNVAVNSRGLLAGNGTITTTGGTTINGGTFAPTGTNALTVNGNLTFTNSAIYVWNLFNNSTSATGGTNFTVTSALNNGALTVSGSIFNVTIGTNVSTGAFWSNNEVWPVMTGTSISSGTNFTLAFLGNTNAIISSRFSLVSSDGSLNLVYSAPFIPGNPTFYWATNTQPWTTAANWNSNTVPTNTSAAFLDNGGTAVLSTNGYAGSLTLGSTNGAYGYLVVTNGGNLSIGTNLIVGNTNGSSGSVVTIYGNSTLTVGGISYVGYGGAKSNTLIVSGTNAIWTSATNSYIGYGNGSASTGNSLVITNAGTVSTLGYFQVGYTNGDSGNSVTVTGTNSRLVVDGSYEAYFDIGYQGSSNSMVVSNGAQVILNNRVNVGHGSADYPHTVGSSGNTLIVTGPGTLLSNSGRYLDIGDWTNSTGNLMVVSNQAAVFNTNILYIGYDTASSNNSVIVTGTNTHLINGGDLDLGDYGSANTLVISNGAAASFAGTSYISYYAGSSNNSVLVTGAGSVWSNSALDLAHSGEGSITIDSGGTVIAPNITIASQDGSAGVLNVGTYGGSDTNVLLNAQTITFGQGTGTLNFNQAGTLTVAASILGGYTNFSYPPTGASTIQQLGSGTTVLTGNSTNVTQVIVNGGELRFDGGTFDNGGSLPAIGSITLGQIDAIMTNSMPSTVVITNGAVVRTYEVNVGNGDTPYISQGYNNNRLVVTGTNTSLYIASYLDVGNYRNTNQMIISNGATVSALQTYLGEESMGNTLLVTGANSLLSNSDSVYIGQYGSTNNSLVLTNGGSAVVGSNGLYVGYTTNDLSNSVTVYGNSTLTVSGSSYIGYGGASSNTVTVNGSNAVFTNAGALFVGYGTNTASGNKLLISSGAQAVIGSDVNVGQNTGDNGNSIVVTNANSHLTSGGNFFLGKESASNSLVISSGGSVLTGSNTYVGYGAGASNNLLTVINSGSALSNSANLYVGYYGASNSLRIGAGGVVTDSNGYIGFGSDSSNNRATVTGTGSMLSNSGNLSVGLDGSGNSLLVSSNGSVVVGDYLAIGSGNSSSNNSVVVTNTGFLTVTNGSALYVGLSGSSNSLTVGDGSSVNAATFSVGASSNSLHNNVLVGGGSNASTLNITGDLNVGFSGSHNQVLISSQGTATTGSIKIGGDTNANVNTLAVWGASLTNSGNLTIGYYGSSNALSIAYSGTLSVGTNGTATDVGLYVSSSNNNVYVVFPGSHLDIGSSSRFALGNQGSGNTMLVGYGASVTVTNSDAILGFDTGSSNNSLSINGTNSLFSNSLAKTFYVGRLGGSNSVSVLGGGTLVTGALRLGASNSSLNNLLLVSSNGSVWTNSGKAYIGRDGSANSLVISNGGSVLIGSNLYVGYGTGSSNNSILITGTGSSLSAGAIVVGAQGVSNSLTVANGGGLTTPNLLIGATNGASGTVNVGSFGGSDTAGALGASTITFGSGTGTLNFNQTDTATLSSTINSLPGGASAINQLGTGTTILSNNASSNGASVLVSAGLLQFSGGSFSTTNTIVVASTNSSIAELNVSAASLLASSVTIYSNSVLSGNGTITTIGENGGGGGDPTFNGGTYAPSGTNAMVIFGNTTFTNSGIYAWNLFNNSTNAAGGTNFTVTSILNNGALTVSGSTFDVTLGTNVTSGNFWSNDETWTIMTGTNVGGGTNFNLAFLGNTNAITPSRFSLVNSNGALNLVYTVPYSGPTFYWTTNTNSWQISANWSSNQVPVSSNNAFIDNGGTSVLTNNGTVGVLTIASTNGSTGTLLITNAGSLTVSTNLIIGNLGAGTLTIAKGGSLISSNITIADQSGSAGTLNVGTFGGNDTNMLLNAQTITFGQGTGTLNFNQASTVVVSAAITNPYGSNSTINQLGSGSTIFTGISSGSNDVLVNVNAGTLEISSNAVFNNGPAFRIGVGTSNSLDNNATLIISGGSYVNCYGGSYVGWYGNSNTLTVTGTGTFYTNVLGNWVGYYGNNNTFTISGGATNIGQSTEKDYVGYNGNSNKLVVTGANTVYSNAYSLYVGYGGSGNSALIASNSKAYIDYGFYLGYGDGNSLTVSSGAQLINNTPGDVNYYDEVGYEGNGNSLLVTGLGTLYSNGASLYVDYGTNNSMTVSNGANVNIAGDLAISDYVGDLSNSVTVYGNSTLTIGGNTYIGEDGASSNRLTVTGSNAVLTNAGSLYVGYGSGNGSVANSLVLSNGATAYIMGNMTVGNVAGDVSNSLTVYGNSTLTIGGSSTIGNQDASSNTVTVTGSNAVWTNAGPIYVGYGQSVGSDGNALIISNGGKVYAGGGLTIGESYYDSNNSVLISGRGSILTVTNGLNFGNNLQQVDNNMTISNGGSVIADNVTIGNYTGLNSGFNTLTVDGTNSVLNISASINVGLISSGNSLIITNGGKVYDSNALVSMSPNPTYYNGGSSNAVIVTGLGSLWSNSGSVNIGDGTSPNNSLLLNDHAMVIAQGGVALSTNSLLTGNGTITAPSVSLDNATFAPTGTNALFVNGNLSFTNASIYAWNLFNNSTSTNGGTNFTVPVVQNGDFAVDTTSVFALNFGGGVSSSSPFWTNNERWLVMSGTNPLSAGSNFNLAWATQDSSQGFNLVNFALTESNNSLYLNFYVPVTTNPVINPGTNNLPSYNGSPTTLVINAPTNGIGILAGSNPSLVGIILNSGTLASTNQNSIPTNASVTVNNGTMGFTGAGTNTIGSLFVSGGQVAASNTTISVASFTQVGGAITGGSNVTYWAANYYFAATNTASVDASLDNLGTVNNYHSTAIVTTNSSGAPVAPVVFQNSMHYDGGTVITKGILQLGDSNSTGPITVQGIITNNGYLNYGYNGSSYTPTNTVIGNGVIGQVGTGTLTVQTNGIDSNFTGSFSAANGTLAILTNSALGSSTNYYLAANGTLQFTTGVTIVTNSIKVTNGTGIVDNASGGTLALNGTLTKSGTVLVLAGGDFEVNGQVTGSGAPGSFNSDLVVSNATVILNNGNNNYTGPTYVIGGSTLRNGVENALPTNTVLTLGAISDLASMVNTYDLNPNNQTIAALASAGGATNIVQASTQGSQTLTINGTQSSTYSGLIQSAVALIRSGTGTTTLTGSNIYTGGTTISSGALVTRSATALGNGGVSLNGGRLIVQSLLNIASLNWNGAGVIALPNAGNKQYVNATGNLVINGSKNTFDLSGLHLTSTPVELLASANMGGFSTNEFTATGVTDYSLLISNNALWIEALGSGYVSYPNFVGYAINRNQTNVASALNSFTNKPTADQTVVLNSLQALTNSPASMQQAFNAIMPNFYQQMATIAFNSANAQNMELVQRLWGMRVAEGGGFSMTGFADNTPMVEEGQGDGEGKGVIDAKKDILRPGLDNHWGMFLDANGIFAQANSANMLPGYKSESGGVTTGLTYKWNKNVATGLYAGYQGTYNKSGANGSGLGVGSTLNDNAVRFGVFGTYGQVNSKGEPLGLYANALAGGAYNNYQASRIIDYPGMNRTANSSPGAGELDTMLGGGYDVKKGNFTFGPTASLQYTYLGANGVNETGAQSLNFNSGGWNSSSMLSSVGAHVGYTWYAHKDIVVVPQLSLSWQHEFMQNPYAINGNLGGTTPSFSNWSATPIRDFLYTGVGFTVEFAKNWNTSFFYNAAAGNNNLESQNIFLSAGVKF